MTKFKWFIVRLILSRKRTLDRIHVLRKIKDNGMPGIQEILLRMHKMELGATWVHEDGLLIKYMGTDKEGAAFIKAGRGKLLYVPSQIQKDNYRQTQLKWGHKVKKKVI